MTKNKINIVIEKPVAEVFDFTTNPKNTHLWIDSIEEEASDRFPPKIGTEYKNRGKDSGWNFYKVVEFEKNKVFTLSGLDDNYHVRYSYKPFGKNQTEMEYFEWVKTGELKNPFATEVLGKLKMIMEKNLEEK